MKLFQWTSETLRNYGDGRIIVMAASVEEARIGAQEQFSSHLLEHKSWLFTHDGLLDPEFEDEFTRLVARLVKDLQADPKIMEGPVACVIFVEGSD